MVNKMKRGAVLSENVAPRFFCRDERDRRKATSSQKVEHATFLQLIFTHFKKS